MKHVIYYWSYCFLQIQRAIAPSYAPGLLSSFREFLDWRTFLWPLEEHIEELFLSMLLVFMEFKEKLHCCFKFVETPRSRWPRIIYA